MRNRRLSFRKLTGLLSFVCVALVSMSNLCTQHAQVSSSKSVRFVAQSPLTSPTMRGRYNGKLVFSSDRGNDGGIKLWTMNPDGSNQVQLTFESGRGPTLPARPKPSAVASSMSRQVPLESLENQARAPCR